MLHRIEPLNSVRGQVNIDAPEVATAYRRLAFLNLMEKSAERATRRGPRLRPTAAPRTPISRPAD